MSSLDRLIDLAKKTGDRLIVHDPIEGRDMVILDVDFYEQMVLGKKDVRSLSSNQLVDQINRDISAWRVNRELDEEFNQDLDFEQTSCAGKDTDDYNFDSENTWQSAGTVLEDQYPNFKTEENKDGKDHLFFDDLDSEELNLRDVEDEDEIKIEELPLEKPVEERVKMEIPYVEHPEGQHEEESLPDDDEPMFYEEPV